MSGDGYGGITYAYGTIETAAGNIDAFINFMNSELRDIESKLMPLETDWTADSQKAYLEQKNKWKTNAEEIVETLGRLKTALSSAGTRMQEADQAATKMFG
ncbi:WXG100 family type VII secretion target [Actinoplanes sp. NPDC051861]|uniref:WXG100 family type VII secretion target n=1 Tax=Actinoplanes sp. NPDC051861 TaxID=3155170 RepID=UPI00341D07BF